MAELKAAGKAAHEMEIKELAVSAEVRASHLACQPEHTCSGERHGSGRLCALVSGPCRHHSG